jgi:hypothetical protein
LGDAVSSVDVNGNGLIPSESVGSRTGEGGMREAKGGRQGGLEVIGRRRGFRVSSSSYPFLIVSLV